MTAARSAEARPLRAGRPHCLEVPDDCPGLPFGQRLLVGFRAYLEPETATAPDPSELLLDRALRFTGGP